MRKAVLFISIWLLIIGTLRLAAAAPFNHFMALDPVVAGLAIGIGGLALANGSRWFRLLDLRLIFEALGLTLLITAAYGINSPTFGDLRQTYVPIADLFIVLESGIVMILLAAEKSTKALSPLVYLSLIATFLYRRLAARLALPPPSTHHSRRNTV